MTNFILGMLFIYILIPILESIVGLICSALEVLKAKCNLKITKYNNQITKISLETDGPIAHPIGFQYTPEEEDEEYYED